MNQRNKLRRQYSKLCILLILAVSSAFSVFTGPIEYSSIDNSEEINPQSADVYQRIRKWFVYDDAGSELNHYSPTGMMGDSSDVIIEQNFTNTPLRGESCISTEYSALGTNGFNWAGVYWQHPDNNWGDSPFGFNVEEAGKLIFWAKGEVGGEVINFFCGGIDGTYPDTVQDAETGDIQLTLQLTQYTIDLTGEALERIAGGFGWVLSTSNNPTGAQFYLDEIYYEKLITPTTEIASGIFAMRPDELILSGDYSSDRYSSSLLKKAVPGSVMLGYDVDADSRTGGNLEITLNFDLLPALVDITIIWDDMLAPSISSTIEGTTATISVDDCSVWTVPCTTIHESNYKADITSPLKVQFEPVQNNFTLKFSAEEGTIWLISRIVVNAAVDNEILHSKSGFDYGPFRQGQTPLLNIYPNRAELWDDLSILSVFTKSVRTYNLDNTMADFPRYSRLFGVETIAGIWISSDQTLNRELCDQAIKLASHTAGIIVGNEVFFNGYLPAQDLVEWINYVKSNVTVPVTYSDTPENLLANPSVAYAVDFMLVNTYALWANQDINNAKNFTLSVLQNLRLVFPGKEIRIGETGWATAGRDDCTIPNQVQFMNYWIEMVKDENLSGYYFEFFDELWKPGPEIERNWGIFYTNRTPKEAANVYLQNLLRTDGPDGTKTSICENENSIPGYSILILLGIMMITVGTSVIKRNLTKR